MTRKVINNIVLYFTTGYGNQKKANMKGEYTFYRYFCSRCDGKSAELFDR